MTYGTVDRHGSHRVSRCHKRENPCASAERIAGKAVAMKPIELHQAGSSISDHAKARLLTLLDKRQSTPRGCTGSISARSHQARRQKRQDLRKNGKNILGVHVWLVLLRNHLDETSLQ